ncbi:MAG TPA: hypothetical protein P5120_01890 [Spirochaetota bacterium]|nr:hypothetical protein [Spirochaetota bacterium]
MYKLYLRGILLLAAFSLVTSCAKTPERVISPSVKASVVQGEEKSWSIFFTGGIKNENDSTAFINIEGNILLVNDSGEKIASVPFKIPAILPFETGVIKEKIDIKGETAEKVFSMLSVSPDKLGTPDEPGNRFLEDKNVKLDSIKFEKKDIVKLLGEKVK